MGNSSSSECSFNMPTGAKELLANGSWFWLIVLKHGSKLDSMLLDNIKAVQLNLNFRKTMDKRIFYYIFQLILKKGTLTLKKKKNVFLVNLKF